MNLHAFIEYLKYRLKAKGRHGTHSPFVYAFVDRVLMVNPSIPFKKKLEDYFSPYTIALCNNWDSVLPVADNKTIILLEGIHANKMHTAAWQALCDDTRVKMSIDLYEYGMLLFFDEFKEKQHFVLKRAD